MRMILELLLGQFGLPCPVDINQQLDLSPDLLRMSDPQLYVGLGLLGLPCTEDIIKQLEDLLYLPLVP
jgi:hypothetical protein